MAGFLLWLLNAPIPAVFGLLSFVLNFIPSIGSIIATVLPIPFVLFDPDQTVSTAVLAFALPGKHFIEGLRIQEPFIL